MCPSYKQDQDALGRAGDDVLQMGDEELAKKFLEANSRSAPGIPAQFETILELSGSEKIFKSEQIVVTDQQKDEIGETIKDGNIFHKSLVSEEKSIGVFENVVERAKGIFALQTVTIPTSLGWKMWQCCLFCDKQNYGNKARSFSSFMKFLLNAQKSRKEIVFSQAIFSFTLFFLALFMTFSVNSLLTFFPKNDQLTGVWLSFQSKSQYLAFGLSFFSCFFILLPWLFFFSSWLMGVNDLQFSETYHISYLLSSALSVICLTTAFVVVICLNVLFYCGSLG